MGLVWRLTAGGDLTASVEEQDRGGHVERRHSGRGEVEGCDWLEEETPSPAPWGIIAGSVGEPFCVIILWFKKLTINAMILSQNYR